MVAAAEWPELPADVVLLSPGQCRTLWRQFSSDSMYAVRQVSVLAMLNLISELRAAGEQMDWLCCRLHQHQQSHHTCFKHHVPSGCLSPCVQCCQEIVAWSKMAGGDKLDADRLLCASDC